MTKRIVTFIILILLVLLISVAVYFLFFRKKADITNLKPFDSRSEITWNQLRNRLDILKKENFPIPLRDYLDELHGRERYEWGNSREKTIQYLNLHFPGERASVLYAIFVAYSLYLEEVEIFEKDPTLTNWEKLEKGTELQNHFFKGELKPILFPYHPSQSSRRFLYYCEDYIKKNNYTYSKERQRHFTKKRKELYAENFREISQWEDATYKKKILLFIYERELGLMTNFEKAQFLESKFREENDSDFWN